MALEFGLLVPQGWRMDLVGISDPIEAYETMARVAQEAEALGFASIRRSSSFPIVKNKSGRQATSRLNINLLPKSLGTQVFASAFIQMTMASPISSFFTCQTVVEDHSYDSQQ